MLRLQAVAPSSSAVHHCGNHGSMQPCPPSPTMLPACTAQMLEVMKAEAEALAGSTADTAALAERVSRKVRGLGSIQAVGKAVAGSRPSQTADGVPTCACTRQCLQAAGLPPQSAPHRPP